MLILSRHDVEAVLDVRTCMAAMEAALGDSPGAYGDSHPAHRFALTALVFLRG